MKTLFIFYHQFVHYAKQPFLRIKSRTNRTFYEDVERAQVNSVCVYTLTFYTNIVKLPARVFSASPGPLCPLLLPNENPAWKLSCRDALCTIGFLRSSGTFVRTDEQGTVTDATGLVFARQLLLFVLVWNKDSGLEGRCYLFELNYARVKSFFPSHSPIASLVCFCLVLDSFGPMGVRQVFRL